MKKSFLILITCFFYFTGYLTSEAKTKDIIFKSNCDAKEVNILFYVIAEGTTPFGIKLSKKNPSFTYTKEKVANSKVVKDMFPGKSADAIKKTLLDHGRAIVAQHTGSAPLPYSEHMVYPNQEFIVDKDCKKSKVVDR